MNRKLVALAVLTSFSFFEMSCLTFPTGKDSASRQAMSPDELGQAAGVKITHIVLKSGQNVTFSPKLPGSVAPGGDAVVGLAHQTREFAEAEIKRVFKSEAGKILKIETQDGSIYEILSVKESDGPTLYSAHGPITIPFSDIHQVWIMKKSSAATTVLAVGAVCLIGVMVLALVIPGSPEPEPDWDDSCPFVYSWNGQEYVLDAEPYGASISEGLKRTDWIEMSNLRAVDGKYRVLLTNELEETQSTDELKLVAVDHAPGLKVAPDIQGRFLAFSNPRPPLSAVDCKTGRDILAFVATNDRAFWLSDLEGRDPDGDGEFRDELVFEFSKPAGAKTAKVLANVWTTTWGSRSAGTFLGHYGRSLPSKYADVDRHGPFYAKYMTWVAAEELAVLKVWVETPKGWQARAMMVGGAPAITKDKAYTLAVSDVPGETLRIKLRPPVNFWMVNSLAVDYGEGSDLEIVEIPSEKAVDHSGRDVRDILASTDGSYLVSPNPGERTELVFPAPPLKPGLERTVFVKASGFYKVHVDATGEPKAELAERILTEPGFAARFTFREYLKWGAELRVRAEAAKR